MSCAPRFETFRAAAAAAAVALTFALAAGSARAEAPFCSLTAWQQLAACRNETADDFFEASAICTNIDDDAERLECRTEAAAELAEGRELCAEQFGARRDLCGLLGEARYDPDFDPALFDDDFTAPAHPNPYFPLTIGNVWEYEAEDETNAVEVLDATKQIEGVTCIVVNDFVDAGDSQEDTDDWYGLRLDGTVDYCGELSRDFEVFPGDLPPEPELVEIEGSFKAGRDGDKSGTIFPGDPEVGVTYRQEWSVGNAEDFATVISIDYGWGGGEGDLDELVPEDLALLMCADDCVVTLEGTPLEPGEFERKYYARDLGLFLEVNLEDEEINQLVGCNFDPRCDAL